MEKAADLSPQMSASLGSHDYADYADYDSEASLTFRSELNGSAAEGAIDAAHLEELRRQIDALSSETYRSERLVWALAYSLVSLFLPFIFFLLIYFLFYFSY